MGEVFPLSAEPLDRASRQGIQERLMQLAPEQRQPAIDCVCKQKVKKVMGSEKELKSWTYRSSGSGSGRGSDWVVDFEHRV